MAEDWIKVRKNLTTDPRVVRISSALGADRLRTLGGLVSAWCLFDSHTEDGTLAGYTPEAFDEIIGLPGLARAMESVKWMTITPESLVAPRFDEHNGATAKRRAKENLRKMSARDADKLQKVSASKCGPEKEKEKEYSKSTLLLESESDSLNPETPELGLSVEDAFNQFWASYPKKKSKPDALAAWRKLKLAAKLPEILAAIKVATASREWADEQFIPYPATWLRAEGWNDAYLPNGSDSKTSHFGGQKKDGAENAPAPAPKVLYDTDLPEPPFDWRAVMHRLYENPNTELPWGHVPPAVRAEVEKAGKEAA